ncbi:hypothetical protein [Halostella salina]|uniref:hypothetical protein n=1 Tax=Halostella salina TaxID=1547897 RepID=UPI000EF8237C|nr:hypothetical protein [Halostella salina]
MTASVELDGETITIDAAHHVVNDDAQLLHLYLEERAGGIDVTVPLADSAAEAWARTDVGREALGLDTDDDDQDATVTPGSQVEYRGEPWMVIETGADGTHALLDPRSDAARDMCPTSPAAGDCPTVSASIDEVTVIVQNTGGTPLAADGGSNDEDDDGELVTDGGRDVCKRDECDKPVDANPWFDPFCGRYCLDEYHDRDALDHYDVTGW